jgi:hypothetical protein
MGYIVYHKASTAIPVTLRNKVYKTHGAAQAWITRLGKGMIEDAEHPKFNYAIAEVEYYAKHIERDVTRVNLMTGAEYVESVNTPLACSPASETYWSM